MPFAADRAHDVVVQQNRLPSASMNALMAACRQCLPVLRICAPAKGDQVAIDRGFKDACQTLAGSNLETRPFLLLQHARSCEAGSHEGQDHG